MNESNALAVVEPPVKEPPKYREIKTNDFVPLKRGGMDNIPQTDKMFWLMASDGMYLHRKTILGRGLIKQSHLPSHLPKLGSAGNFLWQAPNIPAEICAQIVDFFKRIFEKHKTEAEVILLLNYETLEWSIYVPLQKVSHSSVESAFDPAEIPEKHLIAGSMHSHCDFSPFHSGTDIGDAADMDGVHFTIGFLDKEPKFVAMVMLNGQQFKYEPEDIADFSNLDAAKAPEEWDERVVPTSGLVSKHLPVGYEEVFKTYGKKPSTYQTPYVSNWQEEDEDYLWWKNYRSAHNRKPEQKTYSKPRKYNQTWRNTPPKFWEDYIEDHLLDSILDSGIFSDEDLDTVFENPAKAQDIEWWRSQVLIKLSASASLLHEMGMVVDYNVVPKSDWEPPMRKNKSENEIDDGVYRLLQDDDLLLPEDVSLATRLESEGFSVLEIKADGSVVIDVAKV